MRNNSMVVGRFAVLAEAPMPQAGAVADSVREDARRRAAIRVFQWTCCCFIVLIFGLPGLAVAAPFVLCDPGPLLGTAFLLLAPVTYTTLFVAVAGLLSRPYQPAIVPCRIPRDLALPRYRARRLYGLCWTAVYYFRPIYWIALSVPPLKRLLFRIFGYRGSMDFTVHPDTWIRDLPLLDFGPGAYISNQATLGTNIGRGDGTLLVDRITIGRGALVGGLAMIGPGSVLGQECEVGVGSAIGIRVTLGERSTISPCCTVSHGANVGPGAVVGTASHVGTGARIGEGARLAPGSLVPNRGRVPARAPAPDPESGQPCPRPDVPRGRETCAFAGESVTDVDDADAIRRRPFE